MRLLKLIIVFLILTTFPAYSEVFKCKSSTGEIIDDCTISKGLD